MSIQRYLSRSLKLCNDAYFDRLHGPDSLAPDALSSHISSAHAETCLQASSDDSSNTAIPSGPATVKSSAKPSGNAYEGVVPASGGAKTLLCLSDSQKATIANRRYWIQLNSKLV